MRILEVVATGLGGATPEGGWTAELKPDDVVHTIIEVRTDGGITGYGSVFTSASLVRASLLILEPLLLGENALEPERVSETLHQHTFWQGRGGAITHAISGIDLALWDILGKATGQPVGRLLGGRYRERVRPYASVLMQLPGPLAETLLELREAGFCAFKLGWGPFGKGGSDQDEAIVRTAREAIGENSGLMVDAGGSDAFWRGDLKWAVRTARMLEDYDVDWFEEPLRPDAIEEFVLLRQKSPVPIASGEVLTRRQSFRSWIETGAVDIVQPDVTKVGGLSEMRRIGWTAQDRGLRLIPHGWNTAVGLAADLQLASALTDTNFVEYRAGSPYIDDLVKSPWTLDADGFLDIPDEPGLGISLDSEKLRFYAAD